MLYFLSSCFMVFSLFVFILFAPMENFSELPYAGISFGNYESGTYGGSVHQSLHPNVYQYWYLHAAQLYDTGIHADFLKKFAEFLNTTNVNGIISLNEFLQLVDSNNDDKLRAVYANYNDERATGDHTQPLSILIFRMRESDTPIELDPYRVHLSGPHAYALFSFVRQHGRHFKSQIPDAFMQQHYKRFIEN